MEQTENRAKKQAEAKLSGICEMVDRLYKAENFELKNEDGEEIDFEDEIRQEIEEDPLSVNVRTDWTSIGYKFKQSEFQILLCTGGPAVRIIGELNDYNEPISAKIEYQDWFTPWEEYPIDEEQENKVIDYCRCFYFGDVP